MRTAPLLLALSGCSATWTPVGWEKDCTTNLEEVEDTVEGISVSPSGAPELATSDEGLTELRDDFRVELSREDPEALETLLYSDLEIQGCRLVSSDGALRSWKSFDIYVDDEGKPTGEIRISIPLWGGANYEEAAATFHHSQEDPYTVYPVSVEENGETNSFAGVNYVISGPDGELQVERYSWFYL